MIDNIFPKIHKEGYKFLAISIILTFFAWLLSGILFLVLLMPKVKSFNVLERI